jgi:hypothetical protein
MEDAMSESKPPAGQGVGVRSVESVGPGAIYAREAPAISALKDQGFTGDFVVRGDRLLLGGTDRQFRPEDLTIVNHMRFEGTSDPSDMSIVYALEAHDGTRGTLVDAFGTYADPEVGAVLSRIEMAGAPRRRHRTATVVGAVFVAVSLAALAGWLAASRRRTRSGSHFSMLRALRGHREATADARWPTAGRR